MAPSKPEPRRSARKKQVTAFLTTEKPVAKKKAETSTKKKGAKKAFQRPETESAYLYEHREDINPSEYSVLWLESKGLYYDLNLRRERGKGKRKWYQFYHCQILQRKEDGMFFFWSKMGDYGGEDQARNVWKEFRHRVPATKMFNAIFQDYTGNRFAQDGPYDKSRMCYGWNFRHDHEMYEDW